MMHSFVAAVAAARSKTLAALIHVVINSNLVTASYYRFKNRWHYSWSDSLDSVEFRKGIFSFWLEGSKLDENYGESLGCCIRMEELEMIMPRFPFQILHLSFLLRVKQEQVEDGVSGVRIHSVSHFQLLMDWREQLSLRWTKRHVEGKTTSDPGRLCNQA